jgi:outer membrane autotransporter protein
MRGRAEKQRVAARLVLSAIAIAVGATFGGGPARAACTAAPSGNTPDPVTGILAPATGDAVNCSGASAVSVSNATATGVTATISGTLTPPTYPVTSGPTTTVFTRPGVSLGAGANITNDGTITVGTIENNEGAITLRGTGDAVVNNGIIDASRGTIAISAQAPVSIVNAGTIRGGTGNAIDLRNGDGSLVTLRTGSQIDGTVSVRGVSALPNVAVLVLEGSGSEDDRITGFNVIEKRDAGGASSWVLGTNLQAGSASDGFQSGDFRGPLIVNVIGGASTLQLTGAISDNPDGTKGALVKYLTGVLILSGNNTYSGPTTINAGTLQANGGNAIGDNSAVTVAAGATLALGATETIGSLAGGGNVLLGNHALRTGLDNTSTTFAGSIDGTGALVKLGTGTLRLSGTSTSTGLLSVSGGTLDVAGTVPMQVLINSAAATTVLGTGAVGGIRNILGRVAPGNSVGTLTVTGNYLQSPTGTLDVEIRPDGSAADLLAVGGTATLAGTLTARGENGNPLTPAVNGRTYTVLTAGGGVTGQFGPVAPLGAYTFNTIYNPTNVQLGVTYAGFGAVQASGAAAGTGTFNQTKKSKALDKVPVVPTGYSSGNADFDNILAQIANETATELASTYNAIIAEPYAAFATVLLAQNDYYAGTVLDRAHACSLRGRSTLAGDLSRQLTGRGMAETSGCPRGDRNSVWLDANWTQGVIDGSNGLSGYDYRLGGAVLGADTAISSDAAVGVAVGLGRPKLDSYDLADAKVEGDSYFASAYGTLTRDRWEFAGLIGYTFGSYDSTRRIRFGTIDRTATGSFDGRGVIASAKAAYFLDAQGFDVVPEVGLTYSKIWQDGFTESGANSLNLKVEDADAYSVVTSVGARVGTVLDHQGTRIRPQLLVRYEYDWNAGDDNAHRIVSSFAAVPSAGSIDTIGQNRGEHGLTFAGGVTAQVAKNADLFLGAGYRWNSNGYEYSFGAGARAAW